jgi:hypothetical protein
MGKKPVPDEESLQDNAFLHHWPTFFSDVAQKYGGQPVSFEAGEDLLVDNPPASQVPLLGIEYEQHKGVIISTGSGTAAETYAVEAPDLVWAIHDEDGKLVAVEIIAHWHFVEVN